MIFFENVLIDFKIWEKRLVFNDFFFILCLYFDIYKLIKF